MYVYLRQGAQSGEDWGRKRRQFVATKGKAPVWGGGRIQSQAYTGSVFACTSVRVRQCVCARVSVSVLYTCVLTSRNNHVNRALTPQRS